MSRGLEYLWQKILVRDHELMAEELLSTWVATAFLVFILGATFTGRDSVSLQTRKILDCLFCVLAIFVLGWAMLSFFDLVSFAVHRLSLVFILLSALATLLYTLYLSAVQEV